MWKWKSDCIHKASFAGRHTCHYAVMESADIYASREAVTGFDRQKSRKQSRQTIKGESMIPSTEPYIQVMNKKTIYWFLPMSRYSADEVKHIRQTCGMTQRAFADVFGISVKTLEAWEQGINTPGSAAARLLDLIGYDYGFAAMVAKQPLKEYNGQTVKAVRKILGLPRELFALAIGVSETACGSWEQNKSTPNGPASRLLWLLEREPDILDLLMEKECMQ